MKLNSRKLASLALFVGIAFTSAKAQNSAIEQKITDLIGKMTIEEKVNMLHASSAFTSGGVARLGIPEFIMSDGPHGVRVEHGRGWDVVKGVNDAATYLPTGNTLAATWNPTLGYQFGSVLGSEANARGKDIILGPGINIIRTPLNGRNFEYLSEDPYLISKMVVGTIKGIQDQGVSACLKHFIANNQETNRLTIDVGMSDRALHEIYLPGFKAGVIEGKTNTVMSSYNKFRGQWVSQNYFLLNTILKREWGFDGPVISDWGAVHNTIEPLNNGLDIEMGSELFLKPFKGYNSFYLGDTVVTLVKTGKVKEALIDDKVRRILRVMFKTGMMDKSRKPGSFATKEHQQVALKIAEEGIVLLKNEQNILPLQSKKIKSIAVIGLNAFRPNAYGGGSSQVKATYEITPLQGIKNLVGSNVKVTYSQGYNVARGAGPDKKLIQEALAAAKAADVVIYVGGWVHGYDYNEWSDNAYDAEDTDKPDMNLPFGQDQLINALLAAKPNTVMVMMGGGAVDMTQWVNKAKSIVEGWYPGMEGGNALASILFGKVNPSGKLPMTFPKKLEDSPAHKLGDYPGFKGLVNYNEGIYVGYRYYDTYKVEPQFEFGHGLSYTTFNYSDIKVLSNQDKKVSVSVKIKNTGKMDGAEVVQLYVHEESPKIDRPEKELKSFKKIFLKVGETQEVVFNLDETAFQYYNEELAKWVIDKGKFDIWLGSSSRDIRQKSTLEF
jgi:beta-glucosidase